MNSPTPSDPNVALLAGLFIATNPCDQEKLMRLIDCAYIAGKRDGIAHAMAIIGSTKREQEAQEAQIRG